MSIASFELREIEWTGPKVALVVAALVTTGIHFAIAAATPSQVFAVLGLGLLLGFVVFFTDLWNPVLYLVGALYVGGMTVVWVLAGMPRPLLGAIDKGVQIVLLVLFVYLLVAESRGADAES